MKNKLALPCLLFLLLSCCFATNAQQARQTTPGEAIKNQPDAYDVSRYAVAKNNPVLDAFSEPPPAQFFQAPPCAPLRLRLSPTS